jgi:hypothetical protein
VGVHVIPQGVVVVTGAGVTLLARDGSRPMVYASPREIMASAIDDTYLALADSAALVVLELPTFRWLRMVSVTETCWAGVILSGHRFVCGPSNDWDRIFYLYELSTGASLGHSGKYTYDGLPMRAIPGRDAFVTVTVSSSPSDFYLWRLDAAGIPAPHGDSPYHGAFAASMRFAFFGLPATHLITEQGHFLSFGQTCDAYSGDPCFIRAGELGWPATGERFLAMTEAGDGTHLYAVVSTSASYFDTGCTGTNCVVRRIDAAARLVEKSWATGLTADGVDLLALDAVGHRVVLAWRTGCTFGNACTGYAVGGLSTD